MATIYNAETGSAISDGLQGCETCDEARQAAEQHLREQEYPEGVELEDDDGIWLVTRQDDGQVNYTRIADPPLDDD